MLVYLEGILPPIQKTLNEYGSADLKGAVERTNAAATQMQAVAGGCPTPNKIWTEGLPDDADKDWSPCLLVLVNALAGGTFKPSVSQIPARRVT